MYAVNSAILSSMKKLYRSEDNKIIYGVLGGVGEYLDQDPAFIRFLYLFFTFVTGVVPAAVFYFVSLLVVPPRPHGHSHAHAGGAHAHTAHSDTAAESVTNAEPRDI